MARARFNLLALPCNLLDSTSFYRCMGPLHALRRQRPSLHVSVIDSINWASLSGYDAVLFQRPTTENHVQIARMVAQHGLPVWVEFDDNFFAIPRDNPHYEQFMSPAVHQHIVRLCSVADVVTVTTQALAAVFSQFHKDVRVIPNALMTNLVGHIPDHGPEPRSPIIMWRGSNTHQRDVDTYSAQIIGAAKAHPELRWAFQGYAPYGVIEGIGPMASSGKMQDQLDYFAMLKATRPLAFIVPLADHAFNRCKSNIAAIEAVYAGAVPLVPDWPEWQIPGAATYRDQESFAAGLEELITLSDEARFLRWSKAKAYIDSHLSIDVVNSKRNALVTELEDLSMDYVARAKKRALVAPKLVIEPVKAVEPEQAKTEETASA